MELARLVMRPPSPARGESFLAIPRAPALPGAMSAEQTYARAKAPISTSTPVPLLFDASAALDHAGGDRELLAEVLGVFVEESDGWLRDLQDSANEQDVDRLRRAAHTIKGAASNCGAGATSSVASVVEQLAAGGDLATATARAADLTTSLRDLASSVSAYLRAEQQGSASAGSPSS